MKKPTFSEFGHWLLSLIENLFYSSSFRNSSKENELYYLRIFTSQKIPFLSQKKTIIGLVFFIFLQTSNVLGQNLKSFTPARFDTQLKGDMLLIGNNILNRDSNNRDPNDAYNGSGYNSDFTMNYVNVDRDSGRNFSSSTAKLTIPKPDCYKIVYAGLYWGGILQQNDRSNIQKVRLKLPNATTYKEITGSIVYDANATPIGGDNNKPYACYADITSLITNLTNAQGDYTVANVISSQGDNGGTGLSAGWSIFIVYEDPTLPAKYITTFDGFSGIGGATTLDIPISGFKTIPTGPVKVKFAFAALEGDQPINGDYLKINGTSISAVNSANTVIRSSTNFFNSSVTYVNPSTGITEDFLDRSPASTNTLGYDAGILNIDNPLNVIIANNATNATITLGSTQDVYFYYFNAFAVDIIEPKIVLTKIVENSSGIPIGNANVNLGDFLYYVIGFENKGNDNATSMTIRDVLPINTIFNYPADPNLITLPTGVTVKSYNSVTREIVFDVDKSIVEVGDKEKIRLKVQVVPSCNMLSDACSNSIDNQAFATYKGTLNKDFVISNDPSVNTNTGCLLIPKETNFLVGIDNCKFTKNEVLCGNSVVITAANGYTNYKWSTAPFNNTGITTGTILGNSKTLTVTSPGTYYVYNTAIAPCLSITEEVTVARAGTVTTNPLIAIADKVVECVSGGAGKKLPYFFLCGANATRLLTANISDGATIVWERLSKTSPNCSAVTDPNCANEATNCNWVKMGDGATYTLKSDSEGDSSGEYRLTLNYPGNCFNRFYFNVYHNPLRPTETHSDIICNTKGNITVGGIPLTSYEYSISNVNGTTPSIPYQDNNSFTIDTAGLYTVFIKQKGVTTNPCVFEIKDIPIRQRNFTVDQFITNPVCFNDKGSIKLAANDIRGPYTYEIFKNGTSLNKVTTANSDYTFIGLDAGTYSYTITTADGCTKTVTDVVIASFAGEIKATPSIKVPLTTCTKGIIKIRTQQNNNNTFYYFVNGAPTFQTSNEIEVTASGLYTIRVVGKNNCEVTVTQQVDLLPKPTYTVSNTNSVCYGTGSEIKIENIVPNGHSMSYSIDNGVTFGTNSTFSNLSPGTYNVVVRYGITYTPQNGTPTIAYCQDPVRIITITGATSAVTASAGVGQLAGCGLLQGGQPTGLLRITNAQGGTSPYEYSFDGGVTWENVTQKYVIAGTYNLAVKDALGCVFKIPYTVTLDPKPADPEIDDNIDTIYNCDGSATATIIVNNPTSSGGTTYTYEYYLKTGTNPPVPNSPITSNIFTNVPSGDHTVIVKYNIQTVSSYSNLLFENFGYGDDTTSPGINTTFYCFERQVVATQCKGSTAINDGDYSVTSFIVNPFGAWIQSGDHTPQTVPPTPKGRSLVVNIGDQIATQDVLYQKVINDIIPNQPINFEFYAKNLLNKNNGQFDANLRVALVDAAGIEISWFATGNIPKTELWELYPKTAITLNPGSNTTLKFIIRSNVRQTSGNDVAIDDIKVYQIPKSCSNERSVPIKIDGSKAFKASIPTFSNAKCNDGTDGAITIAAENFTAAGYQYSVDGGIIFQTTTVSPLILSGFGAGTHTIVVRSDATGTCSYTLKQGITAPAKVTVTASITKLPTCTTKATITAVGGGGTLSGYWYELRNTVGGAVVRVFQNNAQFTNVDAGNYTVFARDANSCVSPVGAPVNVVNPTGFTASLAASSDWCFTTADPAKLVVSVSGGLSPFTYSLNGGDSQGSNTFNTVGVGTHSILVTDSNNCTYTVSNIKIEPQLTLTAKLDQDLTCLDPASISVAVTGGYGAPYAYTVSYNNETATAVTSWPYKPTVAGSYVFTVTDSKSCPATSNTIVVSDKTTPTLTAIKTDITCNNKNDGTITVTAANGFTAAYTYAIKLSTATAYITQTTNQFTPLAAGTYNIKVIDSKGCESAVSDVTIVNPALVGGTISATELGCSSTGTVAAVVTVVGSGGTVGTGSYEYSFNWTNNFGPDNTYSTSTSGPVTAYIKDKNGCQYEPLSTTIAPKVLITGINVMFETGLECPAYEAHVKFQAIGGLAPIRYQIITGPSGFSSAVVSDGEFKNLKPGDYVFRATDKNGCSFDLDYNVKSVPDIVAGGSVVTPIKCFGDKGTIQFTVNGVKDRGYDYVIRNGANAIIQSANNVSETVTVINVTSSQPSGVYTITAIDRKTTCPSTYSVTLSQPAVLAITGVTASNVNCNQSISNIVVTATGGVTSYKYAYVIAGSGQPLPAAFSTANTTINTGATQSNLSWDVYIMDQNDCIAGPFNKGIIRDASPSVKSPAPAAFCFKSPSSTAIDLSTFFNLGTGVHTYTVNGSGSGIVGTNYNITASGTYTIVAKDAKGCTATATYVVKPELTILAVRVKDLDCISSGQITFAASNGTSPYTKYEVQLNGAGAWSTVTSPYSTAVAGDYQFRVTDSAGCQGLSNIITITPKTTPTYSHNETQISCIGGNNGVINITNPTGIAPFTYLISKGGVTVSTTSTANNLSAGTYDILVTDSKGCPSAPFSITLVNPTALSATVSSTPLKCGVNNATVGATITVTSPAGGSGGYQYSFNGGTFSGTAAYSTTTAGPVTVAMRDSNNCTQSLASQTFAALNPPTGINFSTPAAITCNAPITSITLTPATGTGVARFTYTIVSGPGAATSNISGASSGIFTGLASGAYTFEIKDANGCTKQDSKTIAPAATIAVSGVKTDVKCFGTNDGTATFTVTGASSLGNFNYALSPNAGTITQTGDVVKVTGLGANTYTLTATDKTTGCISNVASVTINPATVISITGVTASNVNCNQSISNIVVTATGGVTSYKYAYVIAGSGQPLPTAFSTANTTIDTGATQSNLFWDVYIMDQNDCIAGPFNKEIHRDASPSVKSPAPTAFCFKAPSSTPINVSTFFNLGTGVHTYTVNGSAIVGTNYNVTGSGTYTIVAQDANGCLATATYVVKPELTILATRVKDLDCNSNGQITFAASNGTSPYTKYEVQLNGAGAWSTVTSPYSTAVAGDYQFRVTDSAGCQGLSNIITITPKTTPTYSHNETQISCIGGNNGVINITSPTGIAPFTYLISKGGVTVSTTSTASGLNAGRYDILVTDSKGCPSAPFSITLANPTALSATVSSTPLKCGVNNATVGATITVTLPTGGSGGYQYSFNGGAFSSTATYTTTIAGPVTVAMSDSNNCTQSLATQTFVALNPPAGINFSTPVAITCNAPTTSITLTPFAGTGVAPLSYTLVSGPMASNIGDLNGLYSGLIAGTYVFKITDANGCIASDSYTVKPLASITGSLFSQVDVNCNGTSTGSAKISVSGFTAGDTYKAALIAGTGTVSPVGSTASSIVNVTGLAQGIYTIRVTDDATSCFKDINFTITQPSPITLTLASNKNANCTQPLSKVTVTAGGGTSPYSYAYVQNNVVPVAGDYVGKTNVHDLDSSVNTNWDVWVKDANGCTFKIDVIVAKDLVPTVTASVLGQCTASGSTFQIKAVGASGVAPYTYTINTGVAPSPADTFTVAAGTYIITVTDANGCTNTTSVTVNDALDGDAILKKDLTCFIPTNAQIDVTISGGKANFSYKVKFNGGAYGSSTAVVGNTFTTNPTVSGTYQFEITDANGCTKETNVITVNPIFNPVITLVAETQSIKCNGDNTGIITVTIDTTKGLGPFEYNINGGTYQSSNVFTGLTAGTYNVTVKDSKGCINVVPAGITVAQPTLMVIDKTIVPIQCVSGSGISKGSIIINKITDGVSPIGGTGGTAPYTYYVTGINGYNKSESNNPGTTSVTFNVVDFGLYQIRVVDANGCSVIEKDVLVASPPNSLDIAINTTVTCATGGSAVVKITAPFAGVGPFHFNIYTGPGQVWTADGVLGWKGESFVGSKETLFTNLLRGVTYTFIVYSEATKCYYYETAKIPVPSNTSLVVNNIKPKNITCTGSNNGNVSFDVVNSSAGSINYTYEIFEAFTNVSKYLSTTFSVAGSTTASITSIPVNLGVGSYYVYVKETSGVNSGCGKASANFSIKESPKLLNLTASVIKNENCDNLGIITASAKDGTAPYLYMITGSAGAPSATDPDWNSASTFTRAAGTYYVHAKDAYGCIQPSNKVDLIKDPEPVIALSVVNKCVAEGTFRITVNRTTVGIGAHSISVDNSTFTSVPVWPHSVTGLNSGSHTIIVKDANGCIDTETIIIAKPLVATPAITALPTCANNNGVITMSGTGGAGTGTGPYTYTIVPMPASVTIVGNVISGLPAGAYTVTMRDTAIPTNCTTTASVTLIAPTPVTFTTVTTPVVCSGDSNGVITVNLSPGNNNPNYTYEITAPIIRAAQSSNVFNGLAAGTYTVRVNSGRGCSTDDTNVIVGSPTPIAVPVITVKQMTCGGGNLPNAATITVTTSGGTGLLQYSFDNGANYTTNNIYTTTVADTYQVIVKDANDCTTVVQSRVIEALDPPVITGFTKTQMTCPALVSNVTINHTNGIFTVSTPLAFKIVSGPTVNTSGDISGTYTGLAAGDYMFRVTDKNGCIDEELFTVPTVPTLALVPQVVANVNCNGGATGSATFTASNLFASGAFTYSVATTPGGLPFTPGKSGNVVTLTGLVKGQYDVTITDNTTRCSITKSVTITEPALPLGINAVASNVNCNDAVSQLTMSPTGGTPIYTYSIVQSGAGAGAYSSSTFINTAALTNGIVAGLGMTWLVDVHIKDANNCTSMTTIMITKDVTPTVITAALAANQCTAAGNYTFTATGTGVAPLSFSIDGTNFFTSAGTTYTFTVPAPTGASQAYTVTIKDKNGCPATSTTPTTVYKPLTLNVVQDKDITCAAMPVTASQFTLTAGDGKPAYSYAVSINGGGFTTISSPYTTSTIGTYIFRVTDANNCTVTSAVFNVTAPVTPVIVSTPIIQAILCGGSASMQVNVDPLTGVEPYTYTVTQRLPIVGTPIVQVSNNIFTGLLAGTYDIVIRDAKGCTSAVATQVISDPAVLSATASYPVNTTCSVATVITVVGTGGTPLGTGTGYYYSFNGGAYDTSNTFTVNDNTAIQTIMYSVKDANGCTTTSPKPITVNPLNKPTDLAFTIVKAPTCPVPTSDVTLSATSGVAPLVFKIVSGPTVNTTGDATGAYTGLAAGDYMFRVTDKNGCIAEKLFTVPTVPTLQLVPQVVSNVNCNSGATGSATFTASNLFASGAFTYSVATTPGGLPFTPGKSGNVVTLTGLVKGQYDVTITDNTTRCSITKSVTITEPALPLGINAVAGNVNCNNAVSQLTMSPTGGTPTYTYSIVQSGAGAGAYSSSTFINTAALTNGIVAGLGMTWLVDVHIKDANNCTSMNTIMITKDVTPTVTTTTLAANQCTAAGNYTFTATGTGVAPLSFSIDGTNFFTSAGTTYTFTVPAPTGASQAYTVTIKDKNGCKATSTDPTTVYKPLTLNVVQDKDITCAVMPTTAAQFTLTAGDGKPAYSYAVSINGGGFNTISSPYTTSTIGTYIFRVTDANNCTVTSAVFNVTAPVTPVIVSTPIIQAILCVGGSASMQVNVNPLTGVEPYTYTVTQKLPIAGTPIVQVSNNIFTGLLAGTYDIVIRDGKGCTSATASQVISDPAVLSATTVVKPFSCSTTNTPEDAVVTILATGGTAPYSYSFDGGTTFQAGASSIVNTAQNISFVVNDFNGCIFNGTAVVFPYTPPTEMVITATPIYCNTPGKLATVTVSSVTGGVSPYKYEIISPTASAVSNTDGIFNNLVPGTYIIKVTDSNGCSTTDPFEVKEANKIAVKAQLINDVYCNGGNTGSVSFTVSNYITSGNYKFDLTPATGSFTQIGDVITYTGLTANNYTFTVTDRVSGCVATVVDFTVSQLAALSSTSIATKINCRNYSATITVTAVGGTGDYTYAVARAVDPMPAATSFVTSKKLVVDTNNGVDVNWIVYVMDSNGCPANNAQAIYLDANPIIAKAEATQCPSPTETYAITVTASGFSTALQYSADGSNYQTGNVITVNTHGGYKITVKDANGCISAPTSVTILEPLDLKAVVDTAPSCADNDGVVNLTAKGGSANYLYNIDGGPFVAINSFAGVAFGLHTMGVYDTTTRCEFYVPIDLSRATRVTGFDLSVTPVTCNGGADGTITATMATPAVGINDNPVYKYSLNGGTPQISPLFSGLSAGVYRVDVISGRGCPATATKNVTQPEIINVPAPAVVQFGCTAGSNSTNFATITVNNVTGGSGAYSIYEFVKNGVSVQSDNRNSYTESDVTGGSYVVNVYDDKGCKGSTAVPIVINAFISLEDINVNVTAPITCTNSEEMVVTVATTGGTPAAGQLVYTVSGINGTVFNATNTTGVFTGLVIGDYLISVTNTITRCTIEEIHYVNNPNTFELKAVKTQDVLCFGSNEGEVKLTIVDTKLIPKDDAGIFDYVVTGPKASSGTSLSAGPLTLSGLTAGSYTVVAKLKFSPECSVTTSFNIDQPSTALTISETHTEITCAAGNNDGTISVSATGGWPGGYEYELVGPVNAVYGVNTVFTNLTAGSYTVNVKDTKGCIAKINVVLSNPEPIVVTVVPSASIVSCNGDKSVTITAAVLPGGGQGSNYLYTLNNVSMSPVVSSGPQRNPIFTGLGAGQYSVTVTDGWSCSATSLPVTINEPTRVEASLVMATQQTCDIPATLTLTASGGNAPYSYSDTPNFVINTPMVGNSVTFAVGNGTFRYYVRDVNGCISVVSNDIQNDPLEPLALELDIRNAVINCQGDLTGFVVAVAKGGLGNYTYSLLNASRNVITTAVQATLGTFTQLAAGSYFVKVNSGDCEFTSAPINITEPTTALGATSTKKDVTCNGNADGKIIINATGGTGMFKYAISPDMDQYFETNTFENLKPGLYDVVVQDQNGCFLLFEDIEIKEPDAIVAAVVPGSIKQSVCSDFDEGAFNITISGGVGPYSTSLDDINGTYEQGVAGKVQFDFANLSGGAHTVYIKDANTCTYELLVPLDPSVTLNPVFALSYDCEKDLPANKVTVKIDPSNNPADVTYSLDDTGVEQSSNVFTNLAPGDHFIMAHHKNLCVDATPVFNIKQIDPLAMTLELGKLNEIVATATGGSGVYQYTVNGEFISYNNKYIYYRSGDYTVTVTDTNGCSLTVTKYFEFIDIEIPNVFTPNGSGTNDTWKPTKTENYPDLKFVVYDRYGREVGRFGAGESWDGKYKGAELPMGDYWYVLKLRNSKDDREFIGHFTLYR